MPMLLLQIFTFKQQVIHPLSAFPMAFRTFQIRWDEYVSNSTTQSWTMNLKYYTPHLGYGFIGAAVQSNDEKAGDISDTSAEDNLSNISFVVMRCPLTDSKSCIKCWIDVIPRLANCPSLISPNIPERDNALDSNENESHHRLSQQPPLHCMPLLHLFRWIQNFARALSC